MHYTSKDNLNSVLGWETILERGNFLGLNIFHKIHLHETRPLIRKCMPKLDFEKKLKQDQREGIFPSKIMQTNLRPHFSLTFQVCGILCPNRFNVKILKTSKCTQKKN